MASNDKKKYFWLKLDKDFFKRHDIRIVESMPNGKDYILFYLKLLCESTSHEGALRFSDMIPYSDEMLSTITNTNIDIVRSAVKIFRELQMLHVLDDGTIFMEEVQKMIGCETGKAKRMRTYRNEQKLLEGSNEPKCSQEIEIDIEKEIEIDKEIEKDKKETFVSIIGEYTSDSDLVEALRDYVEMRQKQKGFTKRALKLNLKELDKLAIDDQIKIEIVEQSIKNSWKGFYALKRNNNSKQKEDTSNIFMQMYQEEFGGD